MTTTAQLLPWERQILLALTAGDALVMRQLQQQLEGCRVSGREVSTAGVYTTLSPDGQVQPVCGTRDRFCIQDVQASVVGLSNGAGFILWVQHGLLDCLEGYTYDEPWPLTPVLGSVRYVPGPKRNMEGVLADVTA